ncbi:phosphate signaling complex protein PhoU [Sediminispirochaeta bajacaliforniensis]|uniref:phosphate signaling complex protein PhoU n=1 Tax=Sediminispirochaeta bajacaliforniensis TaxID=148 RepID=UPI0003682335|nr:phosphate signaling complex protein PhoU [Sediminispirochaeta bajacaliforniensis]
MDHNTLRQHYSDEMRANDREILKMGAFVEEAVRKSMQCMLDQDINLADKVIRDDEIINNLELKIQDTLTLLIATEQPVAGDLRHVITSLKIVTQLERMGDHAVHIAKAAKKLAEQHYIKDLIDLPKMAEYGIEMLHEVLTAFAENDQDKAIAVAKIDDRIDSLHNQIWRELLTYMMSDVKNIDQATTLLFVSRWLERFGDHATNISEWVVYDCTGKHIELNM